MSNWHNDNWSGNDSNFSYPVENVPRPIRRVIQFTFRFYLLVVCIGAFLWATYAGIQVIRGAPLRTAHPATQLHSPRTNLTKGPRF